MYLKISVSKKMGRKQVDHNRVQKDGANANVFDYIVENTNPFSSQEYKEGFRHGTPAPAGTDSIAGGNATGIEKRDVSERRAVATRSKRNSDDGPIATARGSDTAARPCAQTNVVDNVAALTHFS